MLTVNVQQVTFYAFSALLIASSLMVVLNRHPVRGVLFLVLAFFVSAVLWMLLEAEFLALVMIFVYVGAVMTLFLFVVMMINIDTLPQREGLWKTLPFLCVIAGLLFMMITKVVGSQHFGLQAYPVPAAAAADYSSSLALGEVLYTHYVLPFELAALLLLVAIISAISLAFRGPRKDSKTQCIPDQIAARREDRLRIIDLKRETP